MEKHDSVDEIQRAWARTFPNIDTRPAGVATRILRINYYLDRNAEDVFRGLNTTGASFDVLAALFAAGPPYQLRPTDLYRGHMMSSAGVTARLDVVERAGLAARSRDPRDRRGVLVTLTRTGQKLVREGAHALHARQAFLRKIYTAPERKEVLTLLKRLLIPLERTGSGGAVPPYEAMTAPWLREFPDMDRWLSEFLIAMPLLTLRINRESERLLRDFDLTLTGWWILSVLRRSADGERLTPGELTRTVTLSSAGMTAQLDQLEKRGLVERSPHPDDRRALYVTLTRTGQKLFRETVEPYAAGYERFLSPLPARNRQTLANLLHKVLSSLELRNGEAPA
jgi:DNA-binding MarR family transcriptional regulator